MSEEGTRRSVMECKGIRQMLSAYLEGEVSPEEKRLVEQHLKACAQCPTALEDLKKAKELVRNLEEVEPPPWMTQRIMARVRAENEGKGGMWRKLFYPLHVKIPIEAMATVLVAVIAVYVFKAVEPEMKSTLPVPPAPIITRDEVPTPSSKPKEHTPPLRGKTAPKEYQEKDRNKIAPTPPGIGGEATRVEEKTSLSRPAGEPPAPQKKETPAERPAEGIEIAGSLRKQEPAEMRQAPRSATQERERLALSDAARDTGESKKMAAAPSARKVAGPKPEPIHITVNVKNLKAAASEVEKYLGQLGARKVKKESFEAREILTSELGSQNLKELLEKLETIGEIKEKGVPQDIPEGEIALRIEIVSNP